MEALRRADQSAKESYRPFKKDYAAEEEARAQQRAVQPLNEWMNEWMKEFVDTKRQLVCSNINCRSLHSALSSSFNCFCSSWSSRDSTTRLTNVSSPRLVCCFVTRIKFRTVLLETNFKSQERSKRGESQAALLRPSYSSCLWEHSFICSCYKFFALSCIESAVDFRRFKARGLYSECFTNRHTRTEDQSHLIPVGLTRHRNKASSKFLIREAVREQKSLPRNTCALKSIRTISLLNPR